MNLELLLSPDDYTEYLSKVVFQRRFLDDVFWNYLVEISTLNQYSVTIHVFITFLGIVYNKTIIDVINGLAGE